jgi:DNA-binding transcriptional LysR family regulator
MDRLHHMSVFVAVAEAESFAAAGRRLGMSPPAVTRAVSALEKRLGVRLLTRSTRLVRITEAGERYLEDCRRIIADADEADESVAGLNAAPRGHLSVTAPVLFGRLYVMPGIVEYLRRYPDVTARALFLDRVVNLVDEGLEVAVRIGDLPDSSLKAVRVGQVRRIVCAAPGYLAARGTPDHPEQLTQHTIISASGVTPSAEWRFQDAGRPLQVRLQPRLVVTTNDGAIAATTAGLGITRLLSYQLARQLAAGDLETILSDFELPPLPVHVVHREGRQSSAKVRAFVDLLVARLRADPALQH